MLTTKTSNTRIDVDLFTKGTRQLEQKINGHICAFFLYQVLTKLLVHRSEKAVQQHFFKLQSLVYLLIRLTAYVVDMSARINGSQFFILIFSVKHIFAVKYKYCIGEKIIGNMNFSVQLLLLFQTKVSSIYSVV